MKIIHRDLKSPNILLKDNKSKLIITDLGFAREIPVNEMVKSQIGSPATAAPEVIKGIPYDFRADLYSLGVILYQWIYGKYPYID